MAVPVQRRVPVHHDERGAPTETEIVPVDLDPLDQDTGPDLLEGTAVGDYVIERKIGAGGVGTVYLATHPVIGKRVAVKVVAPVLAVDPVQVERFLLEARAVNEIGSKHIVDIFAYGRLPDGRPYLVMEHLEGEDLGSVLDRERCVSVGEIVPIVSQLCKGLSAAHAKGIIHRDLKPENVFLCTDEDGGLFVKLVDFGLAKLTDPSVASKKTRSGMAMGTPQYMSPEQARGLDVSPRTDVYSLGVILYEALTGKRPFDAPSYLEVLYKHLTEPPEKPSVHVPVPPAVESVVLRCLEKDPARRYSSVAAVAAELERVLAGMEGGDVDLVWQRTSASRPSMRPPPAATIAVPAAEPRATSRGLVAFAVAVGVALVGGLLVLTTPSDPPAPAVVPLPPVLAGAAAPALARPPAEVPAPAPFGSLSVSVPVEGATVKLDGAPVPLEGGRVVSRVSARDAHVVRVEARGYQSYETTVRVQPGTVAQIEPSLERLEPARKGARPPRRAPVDRDGIVPPW